MFFLANSYSEYLHKYEYNNIDLIDNTMIIYQHEKITMIIYQHKKKTIIIHISTCKGELEERLVGLERRLEEVEIN